MEDTLIAVWVLIAGAAFVALPFAMAVFPEQFCTLEVVGRGVYAIGLAACAVAVGLRLARRSSGTDRTSD